MKDIIQDFGTLYHASKLLLPRYTTWFTTLLNTFTSLVNVVDYVTYPIYHVMLCG